MMDLTLYIIKAESDRITFREQPSIEQARRTARAHGTDSDYYLIMDPTAKIVEVAAVKDLDPIPPLTFHTLPPDVQEHYEGLDDAAKNYPLEYVQQTLRFKRNEAVNWATSHDNKSRIDLNDLWIAAYHEKWPIADLMLFYRMMGYSVGGYMEVFMNSGVAGNPASNS